MHSKRGTFLQNLLFKTLVNISIFKFLQWCLKRLDNTIHLPLAKIKHISFLTSISILSLFCPYRVLRHSDFNYSINLNLFNNSCSVERPVSLIRFLHKTYDRFNDYMSLQWLSSVIFKQSILFGKTFAFQEKQFLAIRVSTELRFV